MTRSLPLTRPSRASASGGFLSLLPKQLKSPGERVKLCRRCVGSPLEDSIPPKARDLFNGEHRTSNAERRTPKEFLNQGGFTIIEIMTAMVIFGMVVAAIFASWSAIARGSMSANRAVAAAQRSRVAMRTIEEALGGACSFNADIEYYTFDAENGSEPYLSFVSRVSPSFFRSGRFELTNVRRVTFSVEPGQNYQKRLVLRQSELLKDMSEDEQNSPVVLADDVKKFDLAFWDKQKADWLDEWTQTNQLPLMVKFTLQLGADQSAVTRIVALPSVAVQSGWQIPGSTIGGRANPAFGGSGGFGGGFGGGQLPKPVR